MARVTQIVDSDCASSAAFAKSKMAVDSLTALPQDLLNLRVWDAVASLLPATGGTDDLGLYTQTFGTTPPQVQTGDVKAAGAVTRRARTIIALPDNFYATGTIKIRCNAGMKTTVADVSATIDIECYQLADDGTLSADLCSTAAQSINSLTYANKDFTITSTGLVAGSRLDVRVTIATNDAATATAVIGLLHDLILLCDTQS